MLESPRTWTRFYGPDTPTNFDPQPMSIPEFLANAARNHPTRKALIFQNWSMTYAELERASGVMAANLRLLALRPGMRVAVLMPNLPQTVITFFAVLKAGGVLVMMNPLYMEKELRDQVTDSGAEFLISLDLLWGKVKELKNHVRFKKKIVIASIADVLNFPLKQLYRLKAWKQKLGKDVPYAEEDILPWKNLVKGNKTYVHSIHDPRTELAMLQYTGGTTGVPKGVMLTHHSLAGNVLQALAMLPELTKKHHTLLAVLPFFHIFGLTVCINLGGGWPSRRQ